MIPLSSKEKKNEMTHQIDKSERKHGKNSLLNLKQSIQRFIFSKILIFSQAYYYDLSGRIF